MSHVEQVAGVPSYRCCICCMEGVHLPTGVSWSRRTACSVRVARARSRSTATWSAKERLLVAGLTVIARHDRVSWTTSPPDVVPGFTALIRPPHVPHGMPA